MPTQRFPRAGNLVAAQGRPVRRGRTGLFRRAKGNRGAAGDQRRRVGFLRLRDRGADGRRVVAVDGLDVPARGPEAGELVVGHGQIGRAVDRDLVVVEQHDQAAEAEMPGERDRLVADPFHEAAVAGERIGMMRDHRVAKPRRQQPLGQRHATALARPWPRGPVVVSMPAAAPYSGWPAVRAPSWRKLRI